MRIMIAGMWRWPQYEEAFGRGLGEQGVEVIKHGLGDHFVGPFGRLEQKLPIAGPAAWRLGRAVINAALLTKPDLVLFWRPTHLPTSTLRTLRALGIRTASYNNDDPFSPRLAEEQGWHRRRYWRLYLKALPEFDLNFFYRAVNCEEALDRGARHAGLLLPYFLPWQERPLELNEEDERRFGADLVFVGHFEDDGRDRDILALAEAGMGVRVWGDRTWGESALAGSELVPQPIVPALGEDYVKALRGGRVCLSYLSKLNRDGYTRRCFEIPATGRPMLSERTADLAGLFNEGEEAVFFSSRDELVEKARRLTDDARLRDRIAEGGRRRVWADGHDVASRARQFLTALGDAVRPNVAACP